MSRYEAKDVLITEENYEHYCVHGSFGAKIGDVITVIEDHGPLTKMHAGEEMAQFPSGDEQDYEALRHEHRET